MTRKILPVFFLLLFCSIPSWSQENESGNTPGDANAKYFVVYQYVTEKSTEGQAGEKPKREPSDKKIGSYFVNHTWMEGESEQNRHESGRVPNEKKLQELKEDSRKTPKPLLREEDTLCIPGCDEYKKTNTKDNAGEETNETKAKVKDISYVEIYPLDEEGKLGKPFGRMSCRSQEPDGSPNAVLKTTGFVGPVKCVIEAIKLTRGDMKPEKAICAALTSAHVVTEIKVQEGKVEQQDFVPVYDPKTNKMSQRQTNTRYLATPSPHPNRSRVSPCGFVESICYDALLADDIQAQGPCQACQEPTQLPPVAEEPIVEGQRVELMSLLLRLTLRGEWNTVTEIMNLMRNGRWNEVRRILEENRQNG